MASHPQPGYAASPASSNAQTTAAFQALTAYGVPIPRALHNREAAMAWARQHGDTFAGARIVQHTKTGPRTIWRAA